jgi:UDP-N-acetyl-D-mannosaminuronic acid dehydrogenase
MPAPRRGASVPEVLTDGPPRQSAESGERLDAVVIGGAGHVGLPLAIALAARGAQVGIYDLSETAGKLVQEARLPFDEPNAQGPLEQAIRTGMLVATTDPAIVSRADVVVVVIGTPVDEHLNPDPSAIPRVVRNCAAQLRNGQLLVLRSTVYPGVTELVEELLTELELDIDVAFCPERIAEGKAMVELYSLPQIVAATDPRVRERAGTFFRRLTDEIVELEPQEAELAKLFTNVWRYIKFAAVNQFYMIANSRGLDFDRIRAALTQDYPRAADMPGAGFAAGPCLLKDTMQLAAFNDNNFHLGHAAMLVNEGLPLYVVRRLEERFPLSDLTVGILGMAFKAESDDVRSSLSYKLRRILEFRAKHVLCTDPYVVGHGPLVPLEQVLDEADVLIIGAPHPQYREIVTDKPVADVWNILGAGVRV